MSTVIKIENISKKYVIGHQKQEKYTALRDVIAHKFRGIGQRLRHPLSPNKEETNLEDFWALKDINIEIKQGDRIGIIGRNGAGKSTLLKILSRITEPTTGRITIKGRVASLLEVGTGFHPELTGRENIFLNGAILGMGRTEIKRNFDEIVDFAEVEKFLDTPVKRYSSGMYVRLAFAVAAHLEPEILIIDEVLAVGDAAFQKKCVKKLEDVSSTGRTVLVVSHNMSTMVSLSDRVVLLENGRIYQDGDPRKIISQYESQYKNKDAGGMFGRTDLSSTSVTHYGQGQARFQSIQLTQFDRKRNNIPVPQVGCDLCFKINVKAFELVGGAGIALTIYDENDSRLIDANTLIKGDMIKFAAGEIKEIVITCKNVLLKPDTYIVGLWMGVVNQMDVDGVRYATSFEIEARKEDTLYIKPFPGKYMCAFDIDVKYNSNHKD